MAWYDPFGIIEKGADVVSNVYHKVTGAPTAEERRNAQNMMNDQIKAYREQTELSRQELARKKNESDIEKRRIEEKQIRSLRHNYRAPSLLGMGSSVEQPGMSNKLGG